MPYWKSHYTKDIKPELDGEEIYTSGWVDRIRKMGGIYFIVLRDMTGTTQVVLKKNMVPDSLMKYGDIVTKESVLSIRGKVRESKLAPRGAEIIPSHIDVLNLANPMLPIDIGRGHKTELDVRLNYRFLDLRTPRATAIFRAESELVNGFRDYLRSQNYMEFFPPLIVSTATEGGAELFSIPYFEKQAFLAQSPQLYKEYLVSTNFEKVFSITPVFRAEPHDTPRHLNQFLQVDIEEAFANDEDVMKVLEETIVHGIKSVKELCEDDLKVLSAKLETPEIPFNRYTYSQIIEMLKELDHPIQWGDDLSIPECKKIEKRLGKRWYFITQWPSEIKPFYAYPMENNPAITRSFDLMLGAQEISSGAQRIHDYDMLYNNLVGKNMDPNNFKDYLELRKYGCPPHSGWSIGPERMITGLFNLGNIREAVIFPRDKKRLTP